MPRFFLRLLLAVLLVLVTRHVTRLWVDRKFERTEAEARQRQQRSEAEAAAFHSKLEKLREGEIACLRIPPDLLDRVVTGTQSMPGGSRGAPGGRSPELAGMVNWQLAVVQLTGVEGAIEISVDSSDESFEWRGRRMQVTGGVQRGAGTAELALTATEDGNELRCQPPVFPGLAYLLKSGGSRPEGLLVVIGEGKQ